MTRKRLLGLLALAACPLLAQGVEAAAGPDLRASSGGVAATGEMVLDVRDPRLLERLEQAPSVPLSTAARRAIFMNA